MGLRMDNIHAPTVASGPTSQPTANGNEKKLSLQELITQKENLEAELSALSSVLDSHGVNMRTSLTTFDGFPRDDIDVAQIRTTRARIIRLQTDYKDTRAKLEIAVQDAFASGKASEAAAAASASANAAPAVQAQSISASTIEPPFAKVNSVTARSPAELAGLLAGDKVTRFGSVNWTNHERLGRVAQVVQQHENRVISVHVLRESSGSAAARPLELQLTPRRDWGGRGLLGCHLLPV